MVKLGNDWDNIIGEEFEKEYYLKLRAFLKGEYANYTVYPDMYELFSALKVTGYADTKVVILGQDPYHEPNQAHGMCFSVKPGVQTPPSLLNMYKEIRDEFGFEIPNNGYLMPWAEQGVLLLNAVLTVREGQAGSHANKGWEIFTDSVIKALNKREDPVVFLLWGNYARKKSEFIDKSRHFVLEAAHPSPLSASRGFMGCGHFKMANEILVKLVKTPIDWRIQNI
ncbi:MAG: uracil-DNA glycosylase [Clostridia bacterium]|nr:uracil-DNA glycosylase [Clostridia bacterium]